MTYSTLCGNKMSFNDRRYEGENFNVSIVRAGYARKMPTGLCIPALMAKYATPNARFPPALSPARIIFFAFIPRKYLAYMTNQQYTCQQSFNPYGYLNT